MATYSEIYGLFNDSNLKNKIRVAVIVAANTIRAEDPGTANHANRLIWANTAWSNPDAEASKMYMAVLAANKDATVTTIQNATDTAIQTAVDNAVDVLAGA